MSTRMRLFHLGAVCTATLAAWAFVPATVGGQELAVRVTIAEPSGVARQAAPASGGIPFLPGQVKDVADLALVDASGKPVAAQFSKLAGYDDGSVQWALVDVLVDVPAGGKLEYVVKPGKSPAPARPLDIKDEAGQVAVNTGAAVFVVNKAAFNLLDSVSVNGAKVAGPGGLAITDADGKSYTAKAPAKVSWEYRGPVRATLRVDGSYLDGAGGEFIAYTTRLTFWAGSPAVRVVHSLRNSHPTAGFDAKIKQATLSLSLLGLDRDAGKGADWLALQGAEQSGLLVTHRHAAGCFPGDKLHKLAVSDKTIEVFVVPPAPESTKGLVGYMDGHFAIADLAHKDSVVWLDFGPVGGGDGLEARRKAIHAPLHALADGDWISQTGALGVGRFGTLADEIEAYKKWGWKGFDDEKKLAPARKPHAPNAWVSKVDIHDESEADSVELFSLMYVRTGERGFLDWAEAYANYYKGHAVWRTDGFEYDGFRHERSGVVSKSKRQSSGLKHGWYGPKEYGWSDSRFHMCHQWATGLLDYYCLTGDVDALEGGLDWAEYAGATYPEAAPGKPHSWGRAWGRSFGIVLRAYQLTRDPKWKKLADTFAQVAIKAPNRTEDGLFGDPSSSMVPYFVRDELESKKAPMPARLKEYVDQKGITWQVVRGSLNFADKAENKWQLLVSAQSFEYEACATAVARYAEITGDADAKKLVVDMARCTRAYYWSNKCEHAIPKPYVGFPDPGKVYDRGVWDDAHKNCPGDDGGSHSGYHTRFMTDIFARAYSATGDKEWLDWAKKAWSRGSKRGYWTGSQSCPDNEVAVFVGHSAPKGDQVDIRNSMRLFYEAARAK